VASSISGKGLLIVGIPGTGKSLTAKATAGAFGLPRLRLDMGCVFGGIVGLSEANLRSVIQTAEAIAPCVLWIDEVEKGFSGSKSSGSTDGGTSSRVFGSFLSWMQEKDKPVFVVATANDVSKLPPEFLRKGRFDEMFIVDLPDALKRAQIRDIVIRRHRRKPADFDTVVLSRACEQFTGAEITEPTNPDNRQSNKCRGWLDASDAGRLCVRFVPLVEAKRQAQLGAVASDLAVLDPDILFDNLGDPQVLDMFGRLRDRVSCRFLP